MNNIEEIKGQNQFDCFIKMYSYVANAILDTCGNRGERAVRNALQNYGEDRGENLRKLHLEQGIKTNLSSLMAAENCCGEDPRFFRSTVRATEQVQLWEVYSCPLEHMWRSMNSKRAGSFYCEECVHSMVKAYTGGKGQANLSDRMTCGRDTYCRFSLYYRPANLDEEQKQESFGPEGNNAEKVYEVKVHFIKLYYYLLKEASEILGQEGINAVAVGLRGLAEDMEKALKTEADHVGRSVDRRFLEEFFPVETEMGKETLWEEYSANDAERLLRTNLIRPLEKALDLEKQEGTSCIV